MAIKKTIPLGFIFNVNFRVFWNIFRFGLWEFPDECSWDKMRLHLKTQMTLFLAVFQVCVKPCACPSKAVHVATFIPSVLPWDLFGLLYFLFRARHKPRKRNCSLSRVWDVTQRPVLCNAQACELRCPSETLTLKVGASDWVHISRNLDIMEKLHPVPVITFPEAVKFDWAVHF